MRTPIYRTESAAPPETSGGPDEKSGGEDGPPPGAQTKPGVSAPWPKAVCIYTDGASRGNPGPCAFGFQVFSWNEMREAALKEGETTGRPLKTAKDFRGAEAEGQSGACRRLIGDKIPRQLNDKTSERRDSGADPVSSSAERTKAASLESKRQAPHTSLIHEGRGFLSRHNTNNFAEYQAVVHALKTAKEKGVQKLILYSDSLLLISQLNGQYKVKSSVIRPLFRQCRELLKCFAFYKLQHIPREKNSGADALANQALDEASLPASE